MFNFENIYNIFCSIKTQLPLLWKKFRDHFASFSRKNRKFREKYRIKKCLKLLQLIVTAIKLMVFTKFSRHFRISRIVSFAGNTILDQTMSVVNLTSLLKFTPKKVNFLFQIFARIIIHTSSFKSLFKNLNLALINK